MQHDCLFHSLCIVLTVGANLPSYACLYFVDMPYSTESIICQVQRWNLLEHGRSDEHSRIDLRGARTRH